MILNKTGVSGSNPESPTMSLLLERLPLRQLIVSLLGDDWRRRLVKRAKTNAQVFSEYLDIIAASKSPKWYKETKRLLSQFGEFIGEFPPTMDLFTKFFQRYSASSPSTRARYYFVFAQGDSLTSTARLGPFRKNAFCQIPCGAAHDVYPQGGVVV